MKNFALARDFSVTRTWYQHKDIHKVTWLSPDNKICNQINHILVDRRQRTNVWDVRNMRSAEIESYHYLVRAKIRLKMKRSEKTTKSDIKKWDIDKLSQKDIKEEFIKQITAKNTKYSIISGKYKWNMDQDLKKGIN